jgi:hypothetical protein
VENWKTAPWPVKNDTQYRTFSCSSLTWYELIQKNSSLDNWESFAVQVIAAHLNILTGVTCSDKLRGDLESADKLILNCTWSKTQTEEVDQLLSLLRDFNKEKVMHNMENAKEEDAASEKITNSSSPQLLLLILIPAIILVIAIIVVVVMFIKKKVEDKQSVTATL